MKSIVLLVLAGLCAVACGFGVKDDFLYKKPIDVRVDDFLYKKPTDVRVDDFLYKKTRDVRIADKDFLLRQRLILELLQHVHQHDVLTKLHDESRMFFLKDYMNLFTNVDAVMEFIRLYDIGLLPMNEIFTIYNEHHRHQVIALFHVFYYAKDWDTFYKTLVWARFNVNQGMFIYALTVAVLHRRDTVGIVLPAPYEIYPYYFFKTDVVQQAQTVKMQGFKGFKKIDGVYMNIIEDDYLMKYNMLNTEQKISYFTEDIGLNSYYYYFHADYPMWMGGKEFGLHKDRRGELYLFTHQQLLARYYMERLSNALGVIPDFSFYETIRTGYDSGLRYYNGIHFPVRDNYYNLYVEKNYFEIDTVVDYERRIRDAIDYGFITLIDGTHLDLTKPESIDILGNLIHGNVDSVNKRFYGYFIHLAKLILGGTINDTYNWRYVVPGVMGHFETQMRDPVFYQLYKRIIKWYWRFMDLLPCYTRNEIEFTGVKVESVVVDKLVTYFEKFDSDITNVVDVEMLNNDMHMTKTTDFMKFGKVAHYEGEEFVIKARTLRLNHMPFTYTMNVFSDKVVESVVRVFLAPKYDEFGRILDLNHNRENWFLLDKFRYDLVNGKNIIVRDSVDFGFYVRDRTTYYDLYKMVMLAYNGDTQFTLDMTEAHNGFPTRLMLPKGKRGGMPFQMFFIVTPYIKPALEQYTGFDHIITAGVGSGARFIDRLPFGYPFDRKIDETVWFTSNMYYCDVNIFHKKDVDNMVIGTSTKVVTGMHY